MIWKQIYYALIHVPVAIMMCPEKDVSFFKEKNCDFNRKMYILN